MRHWERKINSHVSAVRGGLANPLQHRCCVRTTTGAAIQESYLKIAGQPDFDQYLNQYDVLYLDITWFISVLDDIRETVKYLQREVIAELREAFPTLGEGKCVPASHINGGEQTYGSEIHYDHR